jgi:transposase-like protein
MAHLLEDIQQVLEGLEAQRCATHAARIELQIGSRDRHQAFDVRAQPDYTTPTEVRFMGDANKRQRAPA